MGAGKCNRERGQQMSAEMTLLKATIDAWAINAKREKEAGLYKPEGSPQAV